MALRILQLCTRIPFPPNDGGTIAMYNIARSLSDAGCNIKILAFNTRKHFIAEEKIDADFKNQFALETVFLDASVKPFQAFLNLFRKESYNIRRFISENFRQRLIEILKANMFDIVQMESLYMAPYLETVRGYSNAKIVLRAHNTEHIIWHRLYQEEKNPLKKHYLKLLSERLYNYEKHILNQFDALLPMTPDDEKTFIKMGATVPVKISPAGIDAGSYRKSALDSDQQLPLSLFHLGSMDWMPNIEAVDWFLEKVWDDLTQKINGVQLHLAGKAMPQRIFDKQAGNLKVYGKIDNAKGFIADKKMMIVPLISGSGMRIKILEGLAAAKVIVSTTVGAEGIKYSNGKNILIADTPQQFVTAIVKLFNDEKLFKSVAHQAMLLAETEYDNKVIAQSLIAWYEKLLASS